MNRVIRPELSLKMIPRMPNHAEDWIGEGLPYNAFGRALRRRFGGRIQRVSLDAGLTCPNVDGAVARGGCNFCDNRSFAPARRVRLAQVRDQLTRGIQTVRHRYKKVSGFIAYFQPATNTYAAIDGLEELYRLALSISDEVVGLAIGTRPDCVPNPVLDLLQTLASEHHVSLEFGMQSIHAQTLRWMNRAHDHDDMINAVDRTRGRGIDMSGHVILGVPGEDHAMMMQTATAVNELGLDSVKIHNLYAVHGTPLGDQVAAGEITMMDRQDYVTTVVDFLERLDPSVVVERISGDAPSGFLIEPKWCLEKSSLKISIEDEFKRRGSRQGSAFEPPVVPPSERPVPEDQTPESIAAVILPGRVGGHDPVPVDGQRDGSGDPSAPLMLPDRVLAGVRSGRLPVLKLESP